MNYWYKEDYLSWQQKSILTFLILVGKARVQPALPECQLYAVLLNCTHSYLQSKLINSLLND